MKKRSIIIVITLVVLLGIFLYLLPRRIGACTKYQCDVKTLFHLSTTIEIDKEHEDFVKVSGNVFKFVIDPLTMYDLNGNALAYAGDSYHFFAQDSHSIYVDGTISVEMVGLVRLFGEAYDIYNTSSEKIAYVSFDMINTHGTMYDMEDNIIADFYSLPLFNDFNVRITEDCPLDEKTVLMIFSSYYSDQSADSANSTHSSSN